ncbi:hypothetical protein CFC21_009135 [Triticum aestivum]|uniref:Rx N-terminal domain-containing protein n=2 Tax=Triticum aestivum TaxID=4565 RepID=A0A9R1IT53_WHEAT|nr:hypothetical protein CFC21_009135 [Triticum aestivum]
MAGVSIGTGAMNSLLGKLTALLSDEYNLLKRVRKEIQFLERELSSMRVLLERLAGMEEKLDGLAKGWRDKVRDLSYDIEDCIDRFMDRLGSGDAKPKFMKRMARRLKTLWARHDIATQIKELKARVMEESERRDRYKLDESYYSATRPVEIDPRITAIYEEVKGLVAMDGPMKHVIALLMDESKELKVVPIVGSGGLGKTTLAMQVYRKIGPGGDFQCQACVSVSRILDLVNLLKDILSQIDKDAFKESQSWKKEQLIREIKQILTGKSFVWSGWLLVRQGMSEQGGRAPCTHRTENKGNMDKIWLPQKN